MNRSTMTVCYGLRPQDPDKPCISSETFLRAVTSGAPLSPPQDLLLPETLDHLSSFPGWEVLGNNTINNCNAVTWANQRRLVTSWLTKREVYPSFEQVIKFYKTQNQQFDPNGTKATNGPGSEKDTGMYLHDGLDHLRKKGGPDGVKVVAFAAVDSRKLDRVRQAISIFGSVWVGFYVFPSTPKQFDRREPFSIPSDEKSFWGHAVLVGGHVPNLKCVTWGDLNQFEDAYWTSNLVTQAYVVIWPEHFGTRSFMLGVDLARLIVEFERLTGEKPILPAAPFSNVYFVKTRNEESHKTEVYVADHGNSFGLPTGRNVSGYGPDEEENGTFVIDNGDLYFIKTHHTDADAVEIHCATASSGYKDFNIHSTTPFSHTDANNGTWTVDGSDVYLIKTRSCGSGHIEIHRASHENYGVFDRQLPTSLSDSESNNGTCVIFNANLYFIKYRNTQSDHVEVHLLHAAGDYKDEAIYESGLGVEDGDNGIWEVGEDGDLYFIKTKNTRSGKVEVHIATAESEYKEVRYYASWIGQDDAPDGTWCVR